MDELVALISKKTGLDKKTSKMVVDMVIDYVKKQLPPAVGAQLDGVLGGKVDLSDGIDLGDAAGLLGGLLGGAAAKKPATKKGGK